MSDYSWGSVAFHYGRWFSHPRFGWCWWPDTVWAPSWVTWRYDNDNCGWAPLPPRSYYRPGAGFYYQDRAVGVSFDFGLSVGAFTFVPWGRFCDARPYQYYLPRPRSVAIYNQTTVINNVVIGNNNTIINRGIPTDRVRERTRTEVRTVNLRTENTRGTSPRQEHFERDGRTLVVQRPASAPAAINASRAAGDRNSARDLTVPRNEVRRSERPSGSASAVAPAIATTPVIRAEVPKVPERQQRNAEVSTPRTRDNRATVVRLPGRELKGENAPANLAPATLPAVRGPEARPTPTPARTPTPIFSKPVVIQTPAYTPSRTVVGGLPPETGPSGNNLNRSSGGGNSTWSAPRPQPNSAGSAPNYNAAPRRSRAVIESAPQSQVIQPSQPSAFSPPVNRVAPEVRREERTIRNDFGERNVRSRSEERVVAPSYTPPAIAPAPAPRPSYTPPSAPAPRIESQPAPSRSESSRSEPRSDAGRSPRNR